MDIHFCEKCLKSCYTDKRVEVDWEPYGERYVPRESVYITSSCCEDQVRTIDGDLLLDYIKDICPVYKDWCHDGEGKWCRYAGDIDDLEVAILLEYFGSDEFVIRATKNGDKPTEEDKEEWEVYEWIEELMRDECDYNTVNFTEWHVTVKDNQLRVRWIL